MSSNKVVRIKGGEVQRTLSPAQKKFNNLIGKIDAQKKRLAEWQEALSYCQREAGSKLAPLHKTLDDHKAEFVTLLDQHCMTQKFTAIQLEKLSFLITDTCEDLISRGQYDDLKPLFNRYSEEDFDTLSQADNEMAMGFVKSMLEEQFGMSLDDAELDADDLEGSAARLADKIYRRQEEDEAAAVSKPKRKKSAKQLAKEAKEQEEAANVSKSIQAVYRQLVAALHPDREPDPAERDRKTELMKEVTVAYGNTDLLKLLELQLAVEQIDQGSLDNVSEDRLKHFNRVLSEQLAELQEEVQLKEYEIRSMLGVSDFAPLSPQRLAIYIKEDIRAAQNAIAAIQHDLRSFKDVKQLKAWLKGYRIPEPDFGPYFDDFPPPFGRM